MKHIDNFNSMPVCALYNKGADFGVLNSSYQAISTVISTFVRDTRCSFTVALFFLTKIARKKIRNYLAIPNNCVLSLSLSQSRRK